MTARFQWFDGRVRALTTTIPQRAHSVAAAQAAGLGARLASSPRSSGKLARDVARPKPSGFLRTLIGSDLIYAGVQNRGATIRPVRARRLLIHGPRTGARGQATRSTTGGDVVASADQVTVPGKHYLDAVVAAFPRLFVSALRRMMP